MSREPSPPPERPESPYPYWFKVFQVVFGLASVITSLFIIANPGYGAEDLVFLLSLALVFSSVRLILAGGVGKGLRSLESIGLFGAGVLALVLVVALVLVPGLSLDTLVILLATSLMIQGLGRIQYSLRPGRGAPSWLRGSFLATGLMTVLVAVVVEFVSGLALLTLVELLAVVVFVSGAEAIVAGLGPTTRKQMTLLRLVTFALFYGIIFVNWIDLFNGGAFIYVVPGYHIWVIIAYFIPFGVLLLTHGWKDWELALSLGLLASLGNDLGYYVVGNAFFGFHVNLLDWYAHQFGLYGNTTLFVFNGGFFHFDVPSWLMGVAIYARIAVIVMSLRHWWSRW